MRGFSLPTDNGNLTEKVYGQLLESLTPFDLKRHTAGKGKKLQAIQHRTRLLIRLESKEIALERSMTKIRGQAHPCRSITQHIQCPVNNCPKLYRTRLVLATHLVKIHKLPHDAADKQSREASDQNIVHSITNFSGKPLLVPFADTSSISTNLDSVNQISPHCHPDAFDVTDEMRQAAAIKVKSGIPPIVFVDVEGSSGKKSQPPGKTGPDTLQSTIVSIGAGHELENYKVRYTHCNPAPFVQPTISYTCEPNKWAIQCIRVHKILPKDVENAPPVELIVLKFFNFASVSGIFPIVILAGHNISYDKSRLLPLAFAFIPNFDESHFVWVCTLPLCPSMPLATNDLGIPFVFSRRLTTLASALLGKDTSQAHTVKFDVETLCEVLVHIFGNWDSVRQKLIEQAEKVIKLRNKYV